MAKILLVEDDNNLREIYEARLQAEGYDIVAARDGEEALTVAMKERPDLIISDVMMPKISGFDMLDIIRSTEETKDVKVIMMTALSQAEDKARADKLGADRYLVKSQVTLEDVAKVAREVLNGSNSPAPKPTDASHTSASSSNQPVAAPTQQPVQSTPPPAPAASPTTVAAAPTTVPSPTPVAAPATPSNDTATTQQATQTSIQETSPAMAAVSSTPTTDDVQQMSQTSDQEQADITAQIDNFIDSTKPAPPPVEDAKTSPQQNSAGQPDQTQTVQSPVEIHQPPTDETTSDGTQPQRTATGKKVIQPLNDPTTSKGPDLDKLLEKEAEKDQMAAIAQDIATKTNSAVSEPVVNEESAGEALRQAAENKDQTADTDNSPEEQHAPEVAISEDGNLHLASSPDSNESTDQPDDTSEQPTGAMNFEESTVSTPPTDQKSATEVSQESDDSVLTKAAEQLTQATQSAAQPTANQQQPTATTQTQTTPQLQEQPNIPHTNGTSIDGVSTPTATTPTVPTAQQQVNQQPQPQQQVQQQTQKQPTSGVDPDDIAL